jgi:H/ACA ribonucleoprotein complex subunit 2
MSSENNNEARLFVSPIAEPLASDKMNKKLVKLIKKSMKGKHVHRGVKETVKAVRKGTKGLVIIAADISPIDVLSHLPILCEDKGIAYIYVRSRAEIGEACKTKRPTSCVLVQKPKEDELKESWERCYELVLAKNPYVN